MSETQLLEMIGKSTGVDPSGLSMTSNLLKHARFDSLSILIFLALLEQEYGLRLQMPRGVSIGQLTAGDLYRMIQEAEALKKGSDQT